MHTRVPRDAFFDFFNTENLYRVLSIKSIFHEKNMLTQLQGASGGRKPPENPKQQKLSNPSNKIPLQPLNYLTGVRQRLRGGESCARSKDEG